MATADPYPEIGKLLAAAAVGPWDRIVLRAEVGDDWGRFDATSYASGQAPQSLDVRGELRMLKLLQDVRRITATEVAPGKLAWRTLVLTLHRDGRFEIDFGQ